MARSLHSHKLERRTSQNKVSNHPSHLISSVKAITATMKLLGLSLLLQSATISHSFVSIIKNDGAGAARRMMSLKASESDGSSAVKALGMGPVQVDMNKYNIPFEEITEQWTANVVPASFQKEEGIYLGAKDDKTLFVDTVKIEFPRVPGQPLGLELLEIAGGREDGTGITIVSGFVDGGMAADVGVVLGDSIVKVAVKRTVMSQNADKMMEETEQEIALATECFGFDKTVEAIGSLPPADGNEMLVLTIRRIRKKPKTIVNLQYPPDMNEPDVRLELFSGENLRRAFLVRGIKLNDALSRRFDNGGTGDCGAEGTCATCVVSVSKGMDLLNPMGQTEQQILAKKPTWRMACKTVIGYGMQEGEMTVRVNPKQWAD
jgi:ferredoxin